MVTAKDVPAEQKLFTDAWNMLKEFHGANDDNAWKAIFDSCHEIAGKAKTPAQAALAKGLLLAVADYLEIVGRGEK